MNTHARQPTADELQGMLAGLLDGVEVRNDSGDAPSEFIARYEGHDGTLLAVLCADIAFVAGTAGALGMLAPDVVDEAVKSGAVGENLRDNFHELANITASLFCGEDFPHVRLVGLDAPLSAAPESARELAGSKQRRFGFEVTLGRYGTGRVVFVLK